MDGGWWDGGMGTDGFVKCGDAKFRNRCLSKSEGEVPSFHRPLLGTFSGLTFPWPLKRKYIEPTSSRELRLICVLYLVT